MSKQYYGSREIQASDKIIEFRDNLNKYRGLVRFFETQGCFLRQFLGTSKGLGGSRLLDPANRISSLKSHRVMAPSASPCSPCPIHCYEFPHHLPIKAVARSLQFVSLEPLHEWRHALVARLDVAREGDASGFYSQSCHLDLGIDAASVSRGPSDLKCSICFAGCHIVVYCVVRFFLLEKKASNWTLHLETSK